MLQRFREIISALAQLVEQPRIFDGDHGLCGKILDQLDLLVGKRADFLTIDRDNADQVILFEHRYDQKSTSTSDFRDGLIRIFQSDVGNMGNLLRVSNAVKEICRATGRNRVALLFNSPSLWCVIQSNVSERIVFVEQ